MNAKESAKNEISKLVAQFKEHESQYKNNDYNETQTRQEFIDPFFRALGWDVDNKEGLAPSYKEVQHEDRVKVEGKIKSPDYSFRHNGKRFFFVEAKKPSVNIKDDSNPAYQIRRYAWSANLKLSILTNFEEFAYYDSSAKPSQTDKASKSRLNYIKYAEYIERFDEIWNLFSKESIVNGNHDGYLKIEKKKGKNSVDDDFLESLLKWREILAKDIYKHNKNITEDHLNYVVQNTIDRIIFLRIAEDRHIEPYGIIKRTLDSKNIYEALFELFKKADDKYNSGLFNFEKDKVSKSITISNKCLNEIIENLYFPNSPYEFSVVPVEILGSAYEQFLGKTIQIKGSKILIEDKPEVRKAGGVYYTPQYIVDYIVQNTVGKMVEGKNPKEVEKIKILDPASGSGSFLLGAYDYLLKYHLDWYTKNLSKSKEKKNDPLNPDGSLTTDVKKRILINNIYGVDIDTNAVEVTKLSLLLKCLEGETEASLQQQMSLFQERVLPTLDSNIKCGNSLVDTDFYEIESDRVVLKKVKPFNWESNFPEVFKQGGFDAVIGNPPYVRSQRLEDYFAKYIFKNFQTASSKIDLSILFIEKSLSLLREKGIASFIVTSQWLSSDYGRGIRKLFSKGYLKELLDFGSLPVFIGTSTYPAVIVFGKEIGSDLFYSKLHKREQLNLKSILTRSIEKKSISNLSDEKWNFSQISIFKPGLDLMLLSVFGKAYVGTKCGLNEAFVMSKSKARELGIEKALSLPYAYRGAEVKSFTFLNPDSIIIYPYRSDKNGEPQLIAEKELKQRILIFTSSYFPISQSCKKDWIVENCMRRVTTGINM